MCWHFKKDATSIIDNVPHDHVEVPHVPPLVDHLVMVLIYVNLSSLCAGILKMVPQVLLIMFSMIMLTSPMSPFSWLQSGNVG